MKIAQLLALVIFGLVSLMGENLRGLRENLKHKIRSSAASATTPTSEEDLLSVKSDDSDADSECFVVSQH